VTDRRFDARNRMEREAHGDRRGFPAGDRLQRVEGAIDFRRPAARGAIVDEAPR
jgi:hypothetical protein